MNAVKSLQAALTMGTNNVCPLKQCSLVVVMVSTKTLVKEIHFVSIKKTSVKCCVKDEIRLIVKNEGNVFTSHKQTSFAP